MDAERDRQKQREYRHDELDDTSSTGTKEVYRRGLLHVEKLIWLLLETTEWVLTAVSVAQRGSKKTKFGYFSLTLPLLASREKQTRPSRQTQMKVDWAKAHFMNKFECGCTFALLVHLHFPPVHLLIFLDIRGH